MRRQRRTTVSVLLAFLLILLIAVTGTTTSSSSSSSATTTAATVTSSATPSSKKMEDHPKTAAVARRKRESEVMMISMATADNNNNNGQAAVGRLESLKQREAELAGMLAAVRREKLAVLRSRPLTIGVIGFGRFGQFICQTFAKYGRVVVTSRSDYTDIAQNMGVTYVPLSDPASFLQQNLDVIVVAVSIMSFRSTLEALKPHLEDYLQQRREAAGGNGVPVTGPLLVDVCSVKEHPRNIMLELLPQECDILCTHPMFGPDSGKDGWHNLNFVYEKTRIDQVLLDPKQQQQRQRQRTGSLVDEKSAAFVEEGGRVRSLHEDSEAHVEGMDRMERFLSIWEEEGCRMVPMTCGEHDSYAANSQFCTHLIGRVLGSQGLAETPIDTSGFQSVLKLIEITAADSFELFYGLYKYNKNSMDTIKQLQAALHDVVGKLHMTDIMNEEESAKEANQHEEKKGEVKNVKELVGQPR